MNSYLLNGVTNAVYSCDRLVTVSLPNMTKNGDSFEYWFGNHLYNAVASGTTLSHPLCLEICLARQLFRIYGIPQSYHLIVACMEVNKFFFQLQVVLRPWKTNHF